MPTCRATLDTPIGPLGVEASDVGITAITFDATAAPTTDSNPHLAAALDQLARYFTGTLTTFTLPLDPAATPFQRRVWDQLLTIPYAATTTYGAIARTLGDPNATRAVGLANGRNPIPIVVPCHRVIGADGSLIGFGGGLERKQWLLDHERRVAPANHAHALLFSTRSH